MKDLEELLAGSDDICECGHPEFKHLKPAWDYDLGYLIPGCCIGEWNCTCKEFKRKEDNGKRK